ncbi:glycosyltransferase family 4 protein [Polynucleobacter paneuropaeus]|nr:glycosyltransferase family 4 protein [Polynucleobacter paneuropaeus]
MDGHLRINYISQFDPLLHRGGGEMIAWDVIQEGRARGHTFTFTTARPESKFEFDETAHFELLVDVFNHPHSLKSLGAWRNFPDGLLEKVINRNRFVHMHNAYADICNLPYLPCSGNANPLCSERKDIGLHLRIALKDFGGTCFSSKKLVRDLFSNSMLNIFLSPLHQDTCLKVMQLSDAKNNFVLKPTVDTNLFFNRELPRDIDYLFVGVISEAKGFYEMRELFRDKNIHLAGNIYPGLKLDFGTYHGKIAYDQVSMLMNRAKNFVFLPRWPEPQGRVVIEAALSGCQLITNDKVGATSFTFDISQPKNFGNPTQELWDEIESKV